MFHTMIELTNIGRVGTTSSWLQGSLYLPLGFLNTRQHVLILIPVIVRYHQVDQNLNFVLKEMHPLK